MRANEKREREELQLIRAASQIVFFFFFLFSLRGAVPAPSVRMRTNNFRVSRLVPAPFAKFELPKNNTKKIFALRVLYLRFLQNAIRKKKTEKKTIALRAWCSRLLLSAS